MSRIDPSGFPVLQPEQAEAAANLLRTMGQAIENHVANADTEWQGLISCYRAPEGDYVNMLFKPAVATGIDVHTAMASAARVLDGYATGLADVKTRLDALRTEANKFIKRTDDTQVYRNWHMDGAFMVHDYANLPWEVYHWEEWPPTVEENNQLLGQAAAIMADLSELESTYGQQIVDLLSPGRRPIVGIGESVFPAYNADQFLNSPVPWGQPQKRRYASAWDNFYSTSHDWLGNTISSIVGFVGVKWDWPPGFSPTLARDSWYGLGMLAIGLGNLNNPVAIADGYLQYQAGDPDFWARSTNLAVSTAGGIVGYDYQAQLDGKDPWQQWKDDPQATTTNTLYNIVGLIVGAKTAGLKTAPWDVVSNAGPLIPDPSPGTTGDGRPTVPYPTPPGEPSNAPAPVPGTTSTTSPPDLEDHSDPGTLTTSPPQQGGPQTGTTVPSATTSTTVPVG